MPIGEILGGIEAVKDILVKPIKDIKDEIAETVAEVGKIISPEVRKPENVNSVVSAALDKIATSRYNLEHVRDWIKDINPNFDPFNIDSPYCNNCGSCALAVFKRLQGEGNYVATAENISYNPQMEALTGMRQVRLKGPDEIRKKLLEMGDGAHAIIGIDRTHGPGHWFNAANIDNKIVAIDGQTGEITPFPPDLGSVKHWEMSMRV